MNFKEYAEMMKHKPYPETLKYSQAVMWLHPERLPLGVVSIGEEYPAVIKIPSQTVNRYGRKVPVIAIAKNAFANHDKVTDIVLPSTIERIPMGAFAGCSGLKRITIPKKIKSIREGTFAGCDMLEDVYYEGSIEEWRKINIVHDKHEIEFGDLVSGTPVQEIKAERLLHIPGNDALLTANIHFHCTLTDLNHDSKFKATAKGNDITDLLRTM